MRNRAAAAAGIFLTATLLNGGSPANVRPAVAVSPASNSLSGDFDGDGYADVAIGAPLQEVAGRHDAGAVVVLFGSPSGLAASGSEFWTQDSPGMATGAEPGDYFGWSLAAGDFDADGDADLAVGAPMEDVGGVVDAGVVSVLSGTPSGLAATGAQWLQGSAGIDGTLGTRDRFGSSLAAGNFGRGGEVDLAVGVPFEDVAGKNDAGAVQIVYGSPNGLTATGNRLWDQDDTDASDAAEAGDRFGTALAAADFGKTAELDLAAGVPGEDVSGSVDAGAVSVLHGSATGLVGIGTQYWTEDSPSIAGAAASLDRFGASLAGANFGKAAEADLAIGAPGKDAGGADMAGAVVVIYGRSAGLDGTGSQLWSQASTGVNGSAEAMDGFGTALAAANFGRSGEADVAIGVPLEDRDAKDGGIVHVLYGGIGGISSTDDEVWSRDSAGISGASAPRDMFGASLTTSNFGWSAQADLAVGVVGHDAGSKTSAGSVDVVYGASTGLTATASDSWTEDTSGVAGTAAAGDRFGFSASGGASLDPCRAEFAFAFSRCDVTVVGAGDIASCSQTNDTATANLVGAIDGRVFTAGDNAYPDGTPSHYGNCYAPTWGKFKARTSPAAGNHEYHTANAAGYFGYFGGAAGASGKGYYSYDLAAWHIVVLNGNCWSVGGCYAGSSQERWLRSDLGSSRKACALAIWHQPRFSSGGGHGGDATYHPFWRALYDFGADVVVNGHEHNYERFAPQTPSGSSDPVNGIREFIVGTGGQSHYGFASVRPNSQVRNASAFGVLELTLHPGSYDWRFVPVPGASFADSGTRACH